MPEYQVLARKYRPQLFSQVLGQDAIVTTLKNAIKRSRIAHAYLFCGMRGTGKTTLARVFAKALNCLSPTEDLEPCNVCSSCKEITSGNSLDVLEIDGASHRGIDDIRQINETVGYATASGKYKIYIIDEVHMLTKEAFNALLKTLEEPPPKVKFFFATTEPHKLPTTILSRCQRFNLNRIPSGDIIGKLGRIAQEQGSNVSEDALRLIAKRAEGGLRDAESLLDQILAFHEGDVDAESVAQVLGIVTRDSFFLLDQAGKAGDLKVAFEIAYQVVSQGKDIPNFIESLTEHFRNILMVKLAGKEAPYLPLSESEREKYVLTAKLYSQEQCLTILDFLVESQTQRYAGAERVMLEALLLRILRSHQRVPVDLIVKRLAELEQGLSGVIPQETRAKLGVASIPAALAMPVEHSVPPKAVEAPPQRVEPKPIAPAALIPQPSVSAKSVSMTEDPTPSKADLGIRAAKPVTPKPIEKVSAPVELGSRPTEEARAATAQQQGKYDTMLQFATVELEGTIKKNAL